MTRAIFLIAGLGLTVSCAAQAQSAGDLQVTAGWLHIDSRLSAGPLTVVQPALGVEPNTGAKADNPNTVGLELTYFLTDHLATETWLGIPPKVSLSGTGNLSTPGLNPLASGRSWAPMLLFKYYVGPSTWKLRPYVGAGAAYKFDTDVRINPAFQQVASLQYSGGATTNAPSSAHFKPGFAPVLNAGATYNIDKHWSINASLTFMHTVTTATITTHLPGGNVVTTSRIRESPLISFVGIGYRF